MRALADRPSIVGTAAQIGSRLWTLLGQMSPTWHLPGLASLTPDFLATHGIHGIIWDVDGTLTPHHGRTVAPAAASAFGVLLATPGLRHVIVSNSNESRFRELGQIFPDIPVLRGYRLAGGFAFQRLLHGSESWSDAAIARDAAGAPAIRKPSAELVQRAVSELGCPPDAVVMVGDQYLTDVAGAALGGVRSIKLPTIERRSFPLGVRVAQHLEQIACWILHSRSNRESGHSPQRRGTVQ